MNRRNRRGKPQNLTDRSAVALCHYPWRYGGLTRVWGRVYVGPESEPKTEIPDHYFTDDRSTFSGVLTVSGNTWAGRAKLVAGGKEYQFRPTFVFAADLASGTFEGEISADGKTLTPWFAA